VTQAMSAAGGLLTRTEVIHAHSSNIVYNETNLLLSVLYQSLLTSICCCI